MKAEIMKFKETDIHYYHNDIKERPTILMLHPAFADHQIFLMQEEAYENRFNLIEVDMIGHGETGKDPSNLSLGDMPEILSEILALLHVKEAHVLGVSLGSLVAQGFADQYPEKTLSVTVVGGYSIHKSAKDIQKAQGLEMVKWLFYILFRMNRFRAYIADVSADSTLGKAQMLKGTSKFLRQNLKVMQGMSRILRRTDDPITYPCLALVGERDKALAIEAARRFEEEKMASYKIVPNAGHCAHIDNYEIFNRIFEDYILDHSSE